MEKRTLEEALHKTSGNVSEASRLLKMTRNTLRYRMAKHHIQSGYRFPPQPFGCADQIHSAIQKAASPVHHTKPRCSQ